MQDGRAAFLDFICKVTLLISSVNCKISLWEHWPMAATPPTGMGKINGIKGFHQSRCLWFWMISVWTAATHLQHGRHCLVFSGQSAGFLGHPSVVLMRDWQTALGFAAKSPKTLDATTPSAFWDSLGSAVRSQQVRLSSR